MLKNGYLVANIGFDTAENGPLKVCQKLANSQKNTIKIAEVFGVDYDFVLRVLAEQPELSKTADGDAQVEFIAETARRLSWESFDIMKTFNIFLEITAQAVFFQDTGTPLDMTLYCCRANIPPPPPP